MDKKDKYSNLPDQDLERPGKQSQMKPTPMVIRDNYKGSGKLKDKVAIITGGDSGIGRSVAVHFAREGAKVAIVYDQSDDDATETVRLIEKEGTSCLPIKGDLKNESFCKDVISQTVDKWNAVDILVNNAGVQFPQDSLTDIDAQQLEKTFSTNVFAMFHLSKAALKHMKSGASIINTSSITAYQGHEILIDYSSTKGAITSFTRALSGNLAKKNIRVNAVAPGPIWTPLIPSTFDDTSNFGADTPMGRAGDPSELGPAYVFLASEDASYITGQTIHVNGGKATGG